MLSSMKNKLFISVIIVCSCLLAYLVSVSFLKNNVETNQRNQDIQSKKTDMWLNVATDTIPAALRNELTLNVENQITQKRGSNYFEDVSVTVAYSRSDVSGGSPELIIGTWKKKDVWGWFAYSDKGVWKTFVDFDGYDCVQIKTLPSDVIKQLNKINLISPQIRTCVN
jgi:uncharacterized membrane protein